MIEYKKISEIIPNRENPRKISEKEIERLKKSITEFPEMLELRPIIIDEENLILGGNMRYKALIELGYEEVPVIQAKNLRSSQKASFIIKDNVSHGEWDWEILSMEWDTGILEEWGVPMPGMELDKDSLSDEFTLSNEEKSPFQKLTFTLHDEQVIRLQNALTEIQSQLDFKWMETYGNENKNGNALSLLIQQWEGLKK